ncbi:MAG: MFS transporter [Chromatocurvus sp.]
MTTPDARESSRHRSAFAESLYRRYFVSSCFSTFAGWLLRFLLGWSAWDLTESAFWVGVVASLMLLPTFVLSPIFGIVSDRINPRSGLLVTLGCQALIAAGTALIIGMGFFSLPALLGLAVMLGATSSAHTPIRLALIPRLVSRDALPSAIGYSAIIFNTSRILGPAAGAALLTSVSTAWAFMASSLLFLLALPVMLSLRVSREASSSASRSMRVELVAGLRYARQHRGIRLILGFTLINGLLGRTAIELLPALSGKLLNGDASTLAMLTASAGVGSIAGGLFISRQSGSETRLLSIVINSLLAGALALMLVYLLPGVLAVGALVMVVAMITTMVGTGCQALAQLRVDDSYRGRVLSLWTVLAMGTPALGAFVLGGLADAFGFPVSLLGFGAFGLLVTLLLARKRRWLMQTEQRPPAPAGKSV